MSTLADRKLEKRIERMGQEIKGLLQGGHREQAHAAWVQLVRMIAKRSPAYVLEMEKAKGLQ